MNSLPGDVPPAAVAVSPVYLYVCVCECVVREILCLPLQQLFMFYYQVKSPRRVSLTHTHTRARYTLVHECCLPSTPRALSETNLRANVRFVAGLIHRNASTAHTV